MNKILLIEDNTEIDNILKNFLITENFQVVAAFDRDIWKRYVGKIFWSFMRFYYRKNLRLRLGFQKRICLYKVTGMLFKE